MNQPPTMLQKSDALEASEAAAALPRTPANASLFSPLLDFLCVGGGSLLFLLLVFIPANWDMALVGLVGFVVSILINHPHFAHSYQLFYTGFRAKAFGDALSGSMRLRYLWAGIAVPILLLFFFGSGFLAGSTRWLGYGANLMFFLVGWHYVKQGYGILIVFSVMKRSFFGDREKSLLRANAYAAWVFQWLTANQAIASRRFKGLEFFTFDISETVWWVAGGMLITTSLLTLWVFVVKARAGISKMPWNGIIGYISALYIWTLCARINPVFHTFVPAFHSLQYLVIVWKYELNLAKSIDQEEADTKKRVTPGRRVFVFISIGILLSIGGFYAGPALLYALVTYKTAVLGSTIFAFMIWAFLNIHHYFLDNVIWRKENKDIQKYLFASNTRTVDKS